MMITCSKPMQSLQEVTDLHVRINLQLYLYLYTCTYRTLTIAVIEIITNVITNTFIL